MMYPFYLLVVIMPLVRHQFWAYTSLAGLTMNKWLGLVVLLTACFHLTLRRTPFRPLHTTQSVFFTLFGLLTMLSFLTRGPERIPVEASPVATWISSLLLLFMASALIDSRQRLKSTLFAIIGAGAVGGLYVIREWQKGGMAAGARPGWVTGDPNYFALSALLCLPLAFLLTEARLPQRQRLFALGCLTLTLAAFLLAASRAGLLGLIASFLTVAWHSRRRNQILAAGSAVLLVLVLVAPTSPLRRFFDPGRADLSSNIAHEALFWAGLRMFEENPVLGVGVARFKFVVDRYLGTDDPMIEHVAHNSFLEVAAEQGIVGLSLLLGTFFFTFRSLRRVRRASARGTDPLVHLAARGIEAALVGACVDLLFLTALHSRLLWFMVILSMCLPAIPAPAMRRPRAAASLQRSPTAESG